MNPPHDNIRWESANTFIESQTKQIAREFKTSRPRPRNRAMGFTGRDQKISAQARGPYPLRRLDPRTCLKHRLTRDPDNNTLRVGRINDTPTTASSASPNHSLTA